MDTPEERARDVARDVHVDPDRLDFTFPDPSRNFEILNNFAKLIPNWFGFARALELSDGEIQQIKENKQLTDGMHAQSVLKKWKEKNGVNAKYGRLITACVQMDIMTVAEKMCKLIPADQIDDDDDEEPKQDEPNSAKTNNMMFVYIIGAIVTVVIACVCGWLLIGAPPTTPPTTPLTTPPRTSSQSGTFIRPGDRPKKTELLNFKLKDGKTTINILTKIGTDYLTFGTYLLEDSDKVANIRAGEHFQPEPIVDKILSEWLNGKGRSPVTWETLIDVLETTGLRVLADDIREQYDSSSTGSL